MLQWVKVRHICEFREITQAKRSIDHLNSVQMENVFCLLWHKEYCFRVEASTSTSFIVFLDIENINNHLWALLIQVNF